MTPEQRQMRARLAALARWSKTPDRTAATAAARSGWMTRFERQVDPESVLPPAERAKRADTAMKAHMVSMAFRSSRNRTKSRNSTKTKGDTGGDAG